ncbi:hypothetical protein D918_07109 [Trichuris suis]|nr:hypothetical protein D918_07109 [Trichuris suis]
MSNHIPVPLPQSMEDYFQKEYPFSQRVTCSQCPSDVSRCDCCCYRTAINVPKDNLSTLRLR